MKSLFFSGLFLVLIFLHEVQSVQSLAMKQSLKLLEQKKPQPSEAKTCDFESESKEHSISDFLRCTDDIAGKSLPLMTEQSSKELETRILEHLQRSILLSQGRQGLGGYPYDERPSGSFYRPGRPILDYLGGEFYGNNGYPAPYDPSGTFNLGLVEALSSISQYDDLKCVPRLLCEIATGSKPGNGEYKASSLGDFGTNTLLGLLATYNLEDASPVLAFGKAALLGYTSKGDSSICYEEYYKCPDNPRDLVHYLNNHNGGFFRFFKNAGRRPVSQQVNRIGSNRISSDRISSNRIGFAIKKQAPPPGLSGPESDRTGTGELKFDTPEPSPRQDLVRSELPLSGDISSRVIFPGDERTDDRDGRPWRNRVSKSLEYSSTSGFFPASSNCESGRCGKPEKSEKPKKFEAKFFPSDNEDSEKTNVVFESVDDNLRDENYYSYSYSKKGRRLADDNEKEVASVFRFPDREDRVSFDSQSGLSRLFPSD